MSGSEYADRDSAMCDDREAERGHGRERDARAKERAPKHVDRKQTHGADDDVGAEHAPGAGHPAAERDGRGQHLGALRLHEVAVDVPRLGSVREHVGLQRGCLIGAEQRDVGRGVVG